MNQNNPPKKKIAFICVHNSCRSQIAESLAKHFRGDEFDFYSAGTEIKPQINQGLQVVPYAVSTRIKKLIWENSGN